MGVPTSNRSTALLDGLLAIPVAATHADAAALILGSTGRPRISRTFGFGRADPCNISLGAYDDLVLRRPGGCVVTTGLARLIDAHSNTSGAAHGETRLGPPCQMPSNVGVGVLVLVGKQPIKLTPGSLRILEVVADCLARLLWPQEDVVLIRDAGGWSVNGLPAADLVTAMILADLVSDPLDAAPRPPRYGSRAQEAERLEAIALQLQFALQHRVIVEQAIGILAERYLLPPRAAFDRLRRAAANRAQTIREMARDVVASTYAPIPLPLSLVRRERRGSDYFDASRHVDGHGACSHSSTPQVDSLSPEQPQQRRPLAAEE